MDWPRSWYPLCRSPAVPMGQVIEVLAFATRLAVFRGLDGQVGVLDARCHHFGADLAHGQVTHAGLRCPLHGRVFSSDGACKTTRGRQTAWPVTEAYGLIFTYLGTGDRPPLPCPDGIDTAMITNSQVTCGELHLGFIGANAFDTAHLAPVHGRELLEEAVLTPLSPDGLRISFAARIAGGGLRDRFLRRLGIHSVTIDTDCWGGNLLFFHHRKVGAWTLHAALPVNGSTTKVFTVSGSGGRGWRARLRLALHHRTVLAFVKEDDRALSGATMADSELDAEADRTLLWWLAYMRALPRAAP